MRSWVSPIRDDETPLWVHFDSQRHYGVEVKSVDHTWESSNVLAALMRIGACSTVPVVVTAVREVIGSPPTITIDLTLEYRSATPVCCPEPGCYIPFLGMRRAAVPIAVQDALSMLEAPRVVIRALLNYELGYVHGAFPGVAATSVITFTAEHFA